MEVESYLRQDVASRKSAYKDRYIDDDYKRILERIGTETGPLERDEDIDQTEMEG